MADSVRRKIDPLLQVRQSEQPLVLGEDAAPANDRAVLVMFRGQRADLEALGMQVASFADGIATGSIRAELLAQLAGDPRVEAIEAARSLQSELEHSAATINLPPVQLPPLSLTGRGVIIGVIDTGIDLWHPAFLRADGRSAVVALWDQTLGPQPGHTAPADFGYGVEYDAAQINAALAAGRGTTLLRHRDTHGHGTHVAGIAAGSALPHRGIAPEADLIVVATATDSKALGDSARTLDAARYVFARAAALGRPAVINLSLGSYLGPHDGTSLLERGIDALLATPGRALIKAAGNAGGSGCHASGTLKRHAEAKLPFVVNATSESATIDIWYETRGRFETVITSPGGDATAAVGGDELRELVLPNGNHVAVSSILGNPNNKDNRIYLVISPGNRPTLQAGTWTITLKAVQRRGVADFDAWIERGSTPPRFVPEVADERMTVSVPGTAERCIAVAAFADRNAIRQRQSTPSLLPFSSRGPTRDGRTQPVLAAPGGWIASARSGDTQRQAFGDARWTLLSGTSMAAPHVAGAVALLLQHTPTLAVSDIRERLAAAATPGSDTEGWGAGALDLQRLF